MFLLGGNLLSVTVANTAGFCFGVNRAINIINDLLDNEKNVCTLGPIIHNRQMVDSLSSRGVKIANKLDEIDKNSMLVIRSHGVAMDIVEQIKDMGIDYVDATCPYVSKIHKIVRKASYEGKIVLIAGDLNHPEVKGIRGNCFSTSFVFKNLKELENLLKNNNNIKDFDVIIVAQTTFCVEEWKKCLKFIKKVYTKAEIFDTICNATGDRQKEADRLSRSSDLMIIVGGRHSSNTAKLKEICQKNCKTFLIETAGELPIAEIKKELSIGVTAGASTPAIIIKEVLKTMSEVLNNNEAEKKADNDQEVSFEEMLEESLKNLNTDNQVQGVVVRVEPNEVCVDVGRKQAGFIPISELSYDPNAKVEDLVKVGDKLNLLIMRTDDQEGTIMLSKKRLDIIKSWDKIIDANETGEILKGKITKVVNGGLLSQIDGIRVFIPASQATESKNESYEGLLNKEVEFKIIEVNKKRRKVVASIKAVLLEKKAKKQEEFWENLEIGKHYTGIVKSLTSFGAFVDIGDIDGLIHISELSWSRINQPSDVLKVGDTVDVYIKDFDRQNNRISLGYKKESDNPWLKIKNDYPVGTIVEAEIVGLTSFGAFARIIPGVDGLIHISQIADKRVDKIQDELSIGQKVRAVITEVDLEKKRISLSIKALLDKEENVPDLNIETEESNEKNDLNVEE